VLRDGKIIRNALNDIRVASSSDLRFIDKSNG
jgi:hypothetical protein